MVLRMKLYTYPRTGAKNIFSSASSPASVVTVSADRKTESSWETGVRGIAAALASQGLIKFPVPSLNTSNKQQV
jgi:hypothetical protein